MPLPPISLAKIKMVDNNQCAQEHRVVALPSWESRSASLEGRFGKSYWHLRSTTP